VAWIVDVEHGFSVGILYSILINIKKFVELKKIKVVQNGQILFKKTIKTFDNQQKNL
jgi:hypothetical protein